MMTAAPAPAPVTESTTIMLGERGRESASPPEVFPVETPLHGTCSSDEPVTHATFVTLTVAVNVEITVWTEVTVAYDSIVVVEPGRVVVVV